MNSKLIALLVSLALLFQLMACGTGNKEKQNYRICHQRLIKLVNDEPAAKVSTNPALPNKILDLCRIYGFETIHQFNAARDKYPGLVPDTDASRQLDQILEEIKGNIQTTKDHPPPEGAKKTETESPTSEEFDQQPSEEEFTEARERAFSLKLLLEQVYEYRGRPLPQNLAQFCGLNKILGYVLDETQRDIIIVGEVDDTAPPLYLEDFVVALRNAFSKYVELKDNTLYYSNPGCTIDPDSTVLQELDDVWSDTSRNRSERNVERILKRWETVCRAPQKVGVFGVPFDSRFAWVMVKADYDLKNLTSGADTLDIPGFFSLKGLKIQQAKEYLEARKTINFSMTSMNRFWFNPGSNRYREYRGTVFIASCPVMLLTEEEHLTRDGDVKGLGHAEPFAEEFTRSFSRLYAQISRRRPIYRELENLYRFVALAKIFKRRTPHKQVGLNLDYLLVQFPLPRVAVERTLSGRYHVKRFQHRQATADGTSTLMFWLPSCGGVSIKIDAAEEDFSKDPNLKNLKDIIVKQRTSSRQLIWDVNQLPGKRQRQSAVNQNEIYQLNKINRENAGSSVTLLVNLSPTGYNLYSDSIQSDYTGHNSYELFNKALERLSGEQALCLDLINFPNKRAETLIETLKIHKKLMKIQSHLVTVSGKGKATESREALYSTDTQVTVLKTEIPQVNLETEGKFKGFYRTTLKFLAQTKKKLIGMSMTLHANTRAGLEALQQKLWQKRATGRNKNPLLKDILDSIKEIEGRQKKRQRVNIVIEFLEQILGIEISRLSPLHLHAPAAPGTSPTPGKMTAKPVTVKIAA